MHFYVIDEPAVFFYHQIYQILFIARIKYALAI